MKTQYFIFLFLLIPMVQYAQQDAQLSQYMYNKLYFNPATAGVDKDLSSISLLHRTQWAGYSPTNEGDGQAPTTQVFSLETPIIIGDANYYFGTGLTLVNDKLGSSENLQIQLSLAYHLRVKKGQISVGLRVGGYKSIAGGKFRFVDSEPNYANSISQSKSDFAVGVYYHTTKFYFGGSMNHLLKSSFIGVPEDGDPVSYLSLENHTWLTTGVNIEYSRSIMLSPSLIVKKVLNTYSIEGSLIATMNDKYYVGISMREVESLVLLLGMNALANNRLKVGYAFDFTLEASEAKAIPSHEIMLTYTLKPLLFFRSKVPVRTPRFRFFENE